MTSAWPVQYKVVPSTDIRGWYKQTLCDHHTCILANNCSQLGNRGENPKYIHTTIQSKLPIRTTTHNILLPLTVPFGSSWREMYSCPRSRPWTRASTSSVTTTCCFCIHWMTFCPHWMTFCSCWMTFCPCRITVCPCWRPTILQKGIVSTAQRQP